MKRTHLDLSKRAYISPDIKQVEATTEYGTLADHFSGGEPEFEIDEEADDSDDAPRARKYSIWDYETWY